jgi:hypothetical protein
MAKEVRANLGTRLTEEEEKAVDINKVVKLTAQPNDTVVAGQDYVAVQVCPYCGCVGYGVEGEFYYRTFTCHCCGRNFRA